ncbi:MAG: DNA damage-inducible protein D [Ktedonobacteraceae bacterium]
MADEEQTNPPRLSPFDVIRHVDEHLGEYWSARELYKLLGYTEWRNFHTVVVKRAMKACEENGHSISDHFVQSSKVITRGKGAKQNVMDILLSRYAAYLAVMNGDPKMPIVAMGQEYFAAQTRRQELADQLAALPEEQKRLYLRSEISIYNRQLAEAAHQAGVVQSRDFAIFQDHGYMGLYGGLKAKDIHVWKSLQKNQQILDHMGSEELADNIFRAAQTDAKLRREQIQGKQRANQTHFEVGKEVRDTIKRLGGTVPENLPTPPESIQQLQRREYTRLKQDTQPSIFDDLDESERED